ncbi:AAC(3) family N-acetyltransferase [Streptomyces sp. DSM 116496]|uniref:AAC(3) family N-acetyltransferase n=1 Tax=Streptomyces stoeckheimensis TaxID=3344656 RepID=UPI0038B3DDC3
MGELVAGWREAGVCEGMTLMVHASLSALGRVDGGAATVVASLREAVGPAGTVAVPAFTWEVADPEPEHVGPPDAAVVAHRAAVPLFHAGMPVTRALGAVPEALRSLVTTGTRSCTTSSPSCPAPGCGCGASRCAVPRLQELLDADGGVGADCAS